MREEYITTEGISEQTLALTCFDRATNSFFKRLFLLATFLCLYSGSSAFQDSIKRVEIKILLREKAKQEINYDSLYQASKVSEKLRSDSSEQQGAIRKKPSGESLQTDPGGLKEEKGVLNQFKKEIDTQIASIQQKVLKEKTEKGQTLKKENITIKATIVKERVTFIRVGFLIFIAGLLIGLKLNKAAFSISALGAVLIVVALYI
jgi:hypothetical protein